mmetsp:Transcript_32677/g.24135  ORF Transcript_32677/g.24135 Transcript_32677/m.24135 type:complete len:109 (+) Transcript_32677:630-956(+)
MLPSLQPLSILIYAQLGRNLLILYLEKLSNTLLISMNSFQNKSLTTQHAQLTIADQNMDGVNGKTLEEESASICEISLSLLTSLGMFLLTVVDLITVERKSMKLQCVP